ncbi:hypothetical protein H310_03900 [Aphanomyces invadans]|uniref:Transmembrane protein n=1 Tax=Aphanomyces invadans TaxID=157072 RepID=A0A024UGI5_9STRA|nr:hypothetical protein H310_03900 [Aphanomyces invadans]ETW04753.1 hypothetical protein H310_03900 [Aphanomyces invadans]|eukprot:XP_008866191.1 hypothetical protein H310_03900 [Aphanomyces invadans]
MDVGRRTVRGAYASIRHIVSVHDVSPITHALDACYFPICIDPMIVKGLVIAATCLASLASVPAAQAQSLLDVGTNSPTPQPGLSDSPLTTGVVAAISAPRTDAPVTPPPTTEPTSSLPTQQPLTPSPPTPSSTPVTDSPVPPPTPSPPTNSPSSPSTSQPAPSTPSPSDRPSMVPSVKPTSPPLSTRSFVAPKPTPSKNAQAGTTAPSASSLSLSGMQSGGSSGSVMGGSVVESSAPSTSQGGAQLNSLAGTAVQSPVATKATSDTITSSNALPSSGSSVIETLGFVVMGMVVCVVVTIAIVKRHHRTVVNDDHDGIGIGPSFHDPSSQPHRTNLPDSPNDLADLHHPALNTNQALGTFETFMASLQAKSPLASSGSAWHAAAEVHDEVGSYGGHSTNSSGHGYSSSLGSSVGTKSSVQI